MVTLEGQFMRQRLASGLLQNGLTETIGTSKDHYVTIATLLAEECQDLSGREARVSYQIIGPANG